ncbi:MAG TPA: Wadjet anti-phage system protein JetD domain-containing protein [Oscillospiraceae bacterium]|nr:Wadjet anti-phage system protein JetD domain-containing protein [Oscillospiraceae bacterium]
MKTVYDLGKKIVTVTEIQEHFKLEKYSQLVEKINRFVAEGTLSEVKNSGSNGMFPALYKRYRVIEDQVDDLSALQEEINYNFPLNFKRDYYLSNLARYREDKEQIEKLAAYFRMSKHLLSEPMAINERSFAIWSQEKFLKEGRGQAILKNLGLTLEDVNVYLTPEPFVYFSCHQQHAHVLIIENKDTWYTLRKLMLQGQASFFTQRIDAIIYGSGKNIEKSLEDYEHTVEEHLLNPAAIFYWGDIDYEGIGIYERLKKRYRDKFEIEILAKAYQAMVDLSQDRVLPKSKDKQNKNIGEIFLKELTSPYRELIVKVLQSGAYIPQEIVNYHNVREADTNV